MNNQTFKNSAKIDTDRKRKMIHLNWKRESAIQKLLRHIVVQNQKLFDSFTNSPASGLSIHQNNKYGRGGKVKRERKAGVMGY